MGTTVRETTILYSIADHLHQEFFSLDREGEGIAGKAKRREITSPSDLPQAFAKLKRLIAPPQSQQGITQTERKRLEKQVRILEEQITKATRNLAIIDPKYIPGVQEEIKRFEAEKDQLIVELRRKPKTEQDINTQTLELLNSLYWMSMLFAAAADEILYYGDGSPEALDAAPGNEGNEGGAVPLGAAEEIRHCRLLRCIASIDVHTTITGSGNALRHRFEYGEITYREMGNPERMARPGSSPSNEAKGNHMVAVTTTLDL
jgi:hypothetical protein